jgi:FkbH-like protein
MLLKKEHFGSMQVGWQRKSEQLMAIATELNIGLDSLVFLDDDAANREEVKMALPMVTVPDLAEHPEEYARQVLSFPYFNQLTLTEEDRSKGKMYSEERQRKEVIAESGDAYLAKLGIEIHMTENKQEDLDRLAQLSQKTNQCNLTTRRYSRAELEALIAHGASVFGASVRDRFGNYGTVVLAIVRFTPEPELDTFLMSCRVMGRSVEFLVLDHLFEVLRERGYTDVKASYIKTAKNEPVRELLPQMGFEGETLKLTHYTKHKPVHVTDAIPLIVLR